MPGGGRKTPVSAKTVVCSPAGARVRSASRAWNNPPSPRGRLPVHGKLSHAPCFTDITRADPRQLRCARHRTRSVGQAGDRLAIGVLGSPQQHATACQVPQPPPGCSKADVQQHMTADEHLTSHGPIHPPGPHPCTGQRSCQPGPEARQPGQEAPCPDMPYSASYDRRACPSSAITGNPRRRHRPAAMKAVADSSAKAQVKLTAWPSRGTRLQQVTVK